MSAPGGLDGFRIALALGGARSGKSALAQDLTERAASRRIYIATAEPSDDEMAARIAQHRATRGPGWETVEAPLDLPGALARMDGPGRALLVDCATLWLNNLMFFGRDVEAETARLLTTLDALTAPTTLVSNELGMGLAPETRLGRVFRDAQGRLNQQLAARADLALLVVAGLPMVLRQAAP